MEYRDYYEFRQVDPASFNGYVLPAYLRRALGSPSGQRVLDFGCGLGQLALSLQKAGYQAEGLDISPYAIKHCRALGLICHQGNDQDFYSRHQQVYDFVIMSHVVEHFPKEEIIPLLVRIRETIKPGGAVIVMAPNAQSHTGAYWAYEDFTHYTLFTSGSLFYVLRAAGFSQVEFLDPDSTDGLPPAKKFLKKILLAIYRSQYRFWNRVTSSTTHRPSPDVFGFEVRALGRN
jgi:2-polyprenyl-3-methyl-5-hydroxy-6-metoxy-1,4-benzoquinol methylase